VDPPQGSRCQEGARTRRPGGRPGVVPIDVDTPMRP
jgi:hypothetical protein